MTCALSSSSAEGVSVKLVIRWRPLALWGLFVLALLLRLYGLNWDQGNNFHPDERQILFHVTALAWPNSWAQFLDAQHSPLNPQFFAYGSFPIYLLALLGHLLGYTLATPDYFVKYTLAGRVVSALCDSGTVLLTGLLALRLTRDEQPGRPYAWSVALLAAALVTFTPFQLQLSHFYAVDTMMLFFVMLTLLACVEMVESERLMSWACVAGIGYGLALATKFSAAPLAVPLLVALGLRWYRQRQFWDVQQALFLVVCLTILLFFVTQPYALLDFANYKQQVLDQGNLARGLWDLPYVRQFAGTIPYVYEVQNIVLWGLGLTLGISACIGVLWLCWRLWKGRLDSWLVLLSWIVIFIAITGSFYVKFMRYMLPIYPALTISAAAVVMAAMRADWRIPERYQTSMRRFLPVVRRGVVALLLLGTMFQGLALLNVYSQPNTRVQASRWMYSHLPAGSVLTYEQWDDPLPVAVDGHAPSTFVQASYPDASGQPATGLDLYGDDTTAKAQQLAKLLPTVNAITMATDRLDKSIPRLPARYPLTIHYYQLLFSGQLGFRLAQQFDNRPHLLGITLDDGSADESYSVFDHPTVRIFVRETPYPYTEAQLLQKLLDGVHLPAASANLPGNRHALSLGTGQQADTQQRPPFGGQFSTWSWWLVLSVLLLLLVVCNAMLQVSWMVPFGRDCARGSRPLFLWGYRFYLLDRGGRYLSYESCSSP